MAKEFYDAYVVNGEYKEYPAFSNAKNAQDIKNILTSIFKNQMLTNYPDAGNKAKVAREIIEEYFLIEFNADNPRDSIVKLKDGGVSSAILLAEDDFGEEFNNAKNTVQEKLNESKLLHKDDRLKKLLNAIIASIKNTNDFIELVSAIRNTIKEHKEFKNDSHFVEEILKDIAEVLKPVHNKLNKITGINIDIQKFRNQLSRLRELRRLFQTNKYYVFLEKFFGQQNLQMT